MILLYKEMPKDNFDLMLVGDTHVGNKMRSRSGVTDMLERLSKKDTYAVFMGDAIESITNTDRRYDPDIVEGTTPLQQADEIIAMFKPFRKKMVSWLAGNHESTIKGVGNIVREKICKELEVPYGTFSCRVNFNRPGHTLFSGLFHHGSGAINSTHPDPMLRRSIMCYKLRQKLEPFGADCMLNAMGHTHKLLVYKPVSELYMRSNHGEIESQYTSGVVPVLKSFGYIPGHQRWYVNTGGFLKLYTKEPLSGYAEMSMLQPVELGYVVVRVIDGVIRKIDVKVH